MLWDLKSPYDTTLRKWSKARQDAWDDCERKYYYQYRAAAKGSKHPQKIEITGLKPKMPMARLIAKIVHASIADFIRAALSESSLPDINALFEKRWTKVTSDPVKVLLEFANGRGLTPPLIEQAGQECRKLLGDFLIIWPEYANDEVLYIYDPDSHPDWFLCGSIGVYGQPDLIIRREKYLVIDWKTGEEPDDYAENNLEMSTGIYLACFDHYGDRRAFPEEFEGMFHYLPTHAKSHVITRTGEDYERFTDWVDEKVVVMPETFMEEHYIPDPAKWKCRACNFATVCHDGKQLLDT